MLQARKPQLAEHLHGDIVHVLRRQYGNESKSTHFGECTSNHAPFTELLKLGSTLTEVFKSASSTKHFTSDGKTGVAKSWSTASSPALKAHSLQLSSAGWTCAGDGCEQGLRAAATEEPQAGRLQRREGEICEDAPKLSFE